MALLHRNPFVLVIKIVLLIHQYLDIPIRIPLSAFKSFRCCLRQPCPLSSSAVPLSAIRSGDMGYSKVYCTLSLSCKYAGGTSHRFKIKLKSCPFSFQKMDSYPPGNRKMDIALRGWEFTFPWSQPIRKCRSEVKDMVQYCTCMPTWLYLGHEVQYCTFNIANHDPRNIAPIQHRSPGLTTP